MFEAVWSADKRRGWQITKPYPRMPCELTTAEHMHAACSNLDVEMGLAIVNMDPK